MPNPPSPASPPSGRTDEADSRAATTPGGRADDAGSHAATTPTATTPTTTTPGTPAAQPLTPPGTARGVLTPAAIARLAIGWLAVPALALAEPVLPAPLPGTVVAGLLLAIVAVVIVCSFGVVDQAEHLAHRLGDPYGSLVLTLSIVLIEVVLISAIMLGPGEHSTIARDSVMAVAMIILNLVIGLSLLVGGLRHGDLTPNRAGTSTYLAMLIVLISLAFALPALIGAGGAYTPAQEIPVVAATLVLYAFFLWRQTGAQAGDFREISPPAGALTGAASRGGPGVPQVHVGIRQTVREHRPEILARTALLVGTVLPIVLLSHDMATLLDDGLGRVGAPVALSGLVIAVIVFLPESLTSVRAALAGEMQRVSNLCHGALVSTVGLTIPAVLVIGAATGQSVVLAESPVNLVLLGVSLLLTAASFLTPRVTAVHGAAHLVLFGVYVLALFS